MFIWIEAVESQNIPSASFSHMNNYNNLLHPMSRVSYPLSLFFIMCI